MGNIIKKMDMLFEWVAEWIVVISGVAVCGLIFAGAVMRYVLHTDFYGSEELILLAAFWLYFMGSSLAAKHNTHIQAEMLDMFIKNKAVHDFATILKHIVSIGMCVMASIWSVQYVCWNIDTHMKSNVFRFPMYISVLPIAISFIAWTIYCIRDLTRFIRSLTKKTININEREDN